MPVDFDRAHGGFFATRCAAVCAGRAGSAVTNLHCRPLGWTADWFGGILLVPPKNAPDEGNLISVVPSSLPTVLRERASLQPNHGVHIY